MPHERQFLSCHSKNLVSAIYISALPSIQPHTFVHYAESFDFGERVLAAHAEAAQRMVVLARVAGQRLLVRAFRGYLGVRVILVEALIAAVGIDLRVFGQRATSSPDVKIVNASGHRL